MKRLTLSLLFFLLLLSVAVPAVAGQPAPLDCRSEPSFYGISIKRLGGDGRFLGGPDRGYVYRQDPDETLKLVFFRMGYRGHHIVQFDTLTDDSWAVWNVRSRITPFSDLRENPDDPYEFTNIDFRGGFWRHFILEPRSPGWHRWDVEIARGGPVFCELSFFVYMDPDTDS